MVESNLPKKIIRTKIANKSKEKKDKNEKQEKKIIKEQKIKEKSIESDEMEKAQIKPSNIVNKKQTKDSIKNKAKQKNNKDINKTNKDEKEKTLEKKIKEEIKKNVKIKEDIENNKNENNKNENNKNENNKNKNKNENSKNENKNENNKNENTKTENNNNKDIKKNNINENTKNDKKDKIKNIENDLEMLKKKNNIYKRKILKDLVKSIIFKYRENLQKYFLRYYYNALYLKKIEDSIKKENNYNNKKDIEKNNNIVTNENLNNNINIDEIKVDYKDKQLYTDEQLKKIKRNKELRDLFYNKIRERQNYLHKCFTKFYYKGLMLYMKNKDSQKNLNYSENNNNNPINQITTNNNNNDEKINNNNNDEKINNNNIDEKINNNNTNKEEKPKETVSQPENPHGRARGLRKLLIKKAKEKNDLLRKYFYKFQRAGILLTLRKGTKRASLYKQIEGVDLGTAFNTIKRSHTMKEIDIDENSNIKNFQEALDKKMEDEKIKEEIEKTKNEEIKKKKEEEEKKNEIKKMQEKAIEILLYRADRHAKMILKKNFEIYYLKAKVMSLNNYSKPKRVKSLKKKGKKKRNSEIINIDDSFFKNIIERSNSVENKNENKLNIIEENKDEKDIIYEDEKE